MSPTDPWFDNPLDKMPIARDNNENPRPEGEIEWDIELMKKAFIDAADDKNTYSSRHESTPDFEKTAEDVVSMHEKMYRLATQGGKHTLGGGSENLID